MNINPAEARRRLDEGTAILIDVREPHEHARENIPEASLVPLSRFDSHDFSGDCRRAEGVIFHCQSGARTAMNARRLLRSGFRDIFVLHGGLQAWKRAGFSTSQG